MNDVKTKETKTQQMKYIKQLPININNTISQSVYFFNNILIDDNIYIAQQCNSIHNALFIIDVWNKYDYNIGTLNAFVHESLYEEHSENKDINIEELVKETHGDNSFDMSKQEYYKTDYNYYVYLSDDIIEENIFGEGDNDYKVAIYKKDNILHYIALLFYKESSISYTKLDSSDSFEKQEIQLQKEKNVCNITGLKYKGNSCYQDSVLMALLAIPNKFINKEIVNKYIRTIISNENTGYRCDENDENDIIRRQNIKIELVKIMNSMRNSNDKEIIETCSRLRELIKKCPSIGGQRFYSTITQDAGEFLIFLFLLFNIDKTTTIHKINRVTNNVTNDIINIKDAIQTIDRIEKVSPIISIHSGSLKNNVNINYYLDYQFDTLFDENNLIKLGDKTTYKRKISREIILESEYLVFYLNRLEKNVENKDIIKLYKIIPDESIKLKNNILYLHAIVVHKASHYTCYIKCNNEWYFYNDMKKEIIHVGDYNDLINTDSDERPNPCKRGVLYFYSMDVKL
jgi:hypothetical protein